MFHDTETLGGIHIPYNWAYADQAARESATGLVAADEGKFARQLDDDSIWMLTDSLGPTWAAVNAPGSSFVTAPSTLAGAGTPGQYACDGSYAYLCFAINTWCKWPVTT